MVNQDRSQDPQYMRKLQAKGQTVTLAAQMKSAEMLPTPVAQTGAGGPKGLDGGSGARQMLTDAGFPRAAGAPSSLPTPKAGDGERGRDKARARPDAKSRELATVVRDQMLPTPRAGETADRTSTPGNRFSLSAWASRGCSTLPTPTTNDSKNASLPPSQQDRDWLAGAMLRDDSIPTGAATYLNPSFVEEMMGFPVGWTA
jgi:hypothetical protein